MKKQTLLLSLLKELHSQMSVVEPHQDSNWDCVAHENAMTMINYLMKYANGEADLRRIKDVYFKTIIKPEKENFIEAENK